MAILLNSDIARAGLHRSWVRPLVEPATQKNLLLHDGSLCWRFDGGYEGFKTAVC